MKIVDDKVWRIYYYCDASLDDNIGCNNLLEININDIHFSERVNYKDCTYEKYYYFECPVCHKRTIINNVLIPYDIRGIVESNSNFTQSLK